MTALATVEQLDARIRGGIPDADEEFAASLLADASVLVLDVAGEPDWDDQTAPAIAVKIVLESARRAFNNPDGLITERLGDASWGWHHGTKPGVYLTDDEVARLLAAAGGSTFQAATNVVWPREEG